MIKRFFKFNWYINCLILNVYVNNRKFILYVGTYIIRVYTYVYKQSTVRYTVYKYCIWNMNVLRTVLRTTYNYIDICVTRCMRTVVYANMYVYFSFRSIFTLHKYTLSPYFNRTPIRIQYRYLFRKQEGFCWHQNMRIPYRALHSGTVCTTRKCIAQ